jgi:hypothetical protein
MTLDFIVAVRHHVTVRDWTPVREVIRDTALSISSQSDKSWRAVFVANEGTPMPAMPAGVEVVRVDFDPPRLPDPKVDVEAYFEAIRRDKGQRLLAGLKSLRSAGHVMTVDYDDFVSARLAGYVRDHPTSDGWFIDAGFMVEPPRRVSLLRRTGFNEICGSSLIVAAKHYAPLLGGHEEDQRALASRWLGSHKFIRRDLAATGVHLAPLPFRGAAWRLAGPGETSGKRSVWGEVLTAGSPREITRRVSTLRPVTSRFRAEYFGEQ